MYNLPEAADARHPKGRGNGYVLTLVSKTVYLSGDTEDIAEMHARACWKLAASQACGTGDGPILRNDVRIKAHASQIYLLSSQQLYMFVAMYSTLSRLNFLQRQASSQGQDYHGLLVQSVFPWVVVVLRAGQCVTSVPLTPAEGLYLTRILGETPRLSPLLYFIGVLEHQLLTQPDTTRDHAVALPEVLSPAVA
ncbi:hypothetical protein [Hymenobacter arizonensis]|uniref:Uncharacterized protein n=1 Tax=Hymenobacter arizonensis TaxID=1227077 RepID=A0A1I5TE22_HYMAR|nr:hypothetical protein SAMN04515668_0436 [Hymenobacter arizonensis]